MAKKELAIRLLVDEKQINKALVTLDQDVLSPEEINKRFFDRKPFVFDVDLMEEEAFAMTVAFVALIEADNQEKEKEANERKD
ncbi:hypothetical protein [Dysgonomonas capnocytophagoides]|uniref:hypothetical protein n=1 Tax=Dysgonomonas capnocytophagoides TaxID=45254 RepID=UPI003342B99E